MSSKNNNAFNALRERSSAGVKIMKGDYILIWFVLLFASLITGFIYSIIKLIKEKSFNLAYIISITNVILFVIIFIFS